MAADLQYQLAKEAKPDAKMFERSDGSPWERLHVIYTFGTKHSFKEVDRMGPYSPPTTVWLTNEGISCLRGDLTYLELAEIIQENNKFFYAAQNRVIEKRQQKKAESQPSDKTLK
jgi:hypothetical protein